MSSFSFFISRQIAVGASSPENFEYGQGTNVKICFIFKSNKMFSSEDRDSRQKTISDILSQIDHKHLQFSGVNSENECIFDSIFLNIKTENLEQLYCIKLTIGENYKIKYISL